MATTTTTFTTTTPTPAHYFQQLDNLKGQGRLDYEVLTNGLGPGNGTTWRSTIIVKWTTFRMDQSGIVGHKFIGDGSSKKAAKEEAAGQIVEAFARRGITVFSG